MAKYPDRKIWGALGRLTWLRKLFRRRRRGYVLVYDRFIEDGCDETVEEYYGYFSTPEEARAIWKDYSSGVGPCENVKLCLIVEDWDNV